MIEFILSQCIWRGYLGFPYLIQGGQSKLCSDYYLLSLGYTWKMTFMGGGSSTGSIAAALPK